MRPGKTQWTDDAMRHLLAMKREGLSNTTVRKKLQEIEQKKTRQAVRS